MLNGKQKISNEEKDKIREKKQKIKDRHELANLGGYEELYPLKRGATQD